MQIEKDLSGDSIHNSFKNRSLVFSCSNAITISNGLYKGNVAIISNKQITIAASAVITDIIVAAPRIIIEDNFKGNFQAFASDSIIVKKNVSLYYPSVLGLVMDSSSSNISAIVVSENDTLLGNIFAYKDDAYVLKQAGVILPQQSLIAGQVYSNGFADVKGTIKGSLMCNKIILVTPSSVYENNLVNAVIDITQLSRYYVGINLVEESTVKKVAKWLN